MTKTNKSVVRNQAYPKSEFNVRERHNERKNESYGNGDIVPERSALNVHFKRCEGTYEQEFNRMVESGVVSLRGLKAKANVFDEFVFDVNTAYFENHGGYEYAKAFYAEAYKQAVNEAGGEQYVLSAVLHADERNIALSDELGRDVFHYHLHVVYCQVILCCTVPISDISHYNRVLSNAFQVNDGNFDWKSAAELNYWFCFSWRFGGICIGFLWRGKAFLGNELYLKAGAKKKETAYRHGSTQIQTRIFGIYLCLFAAIRG